MNTDPRLLTERNLWLATTRPNGKPHLIPIWFVWVDGRFYLCTSEETTIKVRNLRANPLASVALEDGTHPLIAECTTRLLAKPFPDGVVKAFAEKFEWNIDTDTSYTILIELTPEKWLSWQAGT